MATKKTTKSKQTVPISKQLFVLWVGIGLLVAAGAIAGVHTYNRFNRAANMANIVSIRELIIRASDNMKSPAPVDVKNGDMYFPEAKLYLPANAQVGSLSYSYDSSQSQLSITTKAAIGQNIAKLYEAQDSDELFAAVPKLQACQRGITLSYSAITDSENVLQSKVHLANGKMLSIYVDNKCSTLQPTATLLKAIKSY